MYGDPGRGTVSALVHGRQPAQPRHLDEQPDHRSAPHDRQDRPARRQPVQPDRATVAPAAPAARSARSRNRLPADMVVTNPEHRAKAEKIWGLPPGTIPAQPGYHTMDMFRALMRGDVKVHVDPDHQPLGQHPQPEPHRAQAGRRTVHGRERHLPDAVHRGGRPDPSIRGVGRARGRVRQLRAAHPALGQDGRSARRGARGRVADHPGREADGDGAPVPLAGRRLARADVRGVPPLHAGRRQGPGLATLSSRRLAACSGR